MEEEYTDRLGNPIRKAFYMFKEDPLDIRFVTKRESGDWVYDKINGRGTIQPEDFKDYSIIEDKEIKELLMKLPTIQIFIQSKLEQLAQPENLKEHPFGEWGKEPLPFP